MEPNTGGDDCFCIEEIDSRLEHSYRRENCTHATMCHRSNHRLPFEFGNHFEEQRRGIVQRRREIGNGRVGETRGEISRTRNDFIIDRMLITIDNFTRNKVIFPRYSILIEMCKEYYILLEFVCSYRDERNLDLNQVN